MVMLKRIPWRLVGCVLAAALALAAVNHFAGFIPFTPQWSAKRASAQVSVLKSEVSTLERTADGNAQVGAATEAYHDRAMEVRDVTARAETEARNAPNATVPLATERAGRLRAADDRLCVAAPTLCPAADAP